jgi:signal transduction histidine kinase
MERRFTFFSYFLHPSFRKSIIRNRKATILVFSHYFTLIALVTLLLLSKTIGKVAYLPTLCAIPLFITALFYFKKKANITVSGNVLSILWYSTLIPILLKTGGINSCFMPWLYSVILIMVLVESYLWAIFWFFVASASCLGIFLAGCYSPNLSISVCTNTDAVISYLLVGFFMFSCLLIFERSQIFVIKMLKKKNNELKIQKKVLAKNYAGQQVLQEQLTESNQDLQVFAYAASHDLKEPLRMMTMYTQLIERNLKNVMDTKTSEYIAYVIDGGKRMQQLLDNLLAYSLLGQKTQDAMEVDLNFKLEQVIQNLTVSIQETDAKIRFSNLPIVTASATEMTQLFQNIIANALKFRKPNTNPLIEIDCKDNEAEYVFTITDNGIGIKKEDQERVFQLFTRIYTHKYEGTGIGLATCKKILSKLKGKIWVSSTEGVGTTFHFTIPKLGKCASKESIEEKKIVAVEVEIDLEVEIEVS